MSADAVAYVWYPVIALLALAAAVCAAWIVLRLKA